MERPCSEDADVSPPTDMEFGYLANSLSLLLEAVKTEIELDQEAAKASLAIASSILQSEIERRSRAKGARTGGLAGWQMACVRSFIDGNLHRTIHASDLSAVARRSKAHFSRSFKQAFGEAPHAYVVRRRLEKACHLMLTSSASLSEIALSVGFFDQAHLCKHFRRGFGQSPSGWRRERETSGVPLISVPSGPVRQPKSERMHAAAEPRIARATASGNIHTAIDIGSR